MCQLMALKTHMLLNLVMKIGTNFVLQIQRQKWSLIKESFVGCKDLGFINYCCASPSTRSIRKQKIKLTGRVELLAAHQNQDTQEKMEITQVSAALQSLVTRSKG